MSQTTPTLKWEMGIHGVSEDVGEVKVCAIASGLGGSNLTVELDYKENTANESADYRVVATQLSWSSDGEACFMVEIINDNLIEKEKVFFIEFSRVIEGNQSTELNDTTMVMIMDDDPLEVVFSPAKLTVRPGAGEVRMCVEVVDRGNISPDLTYRIPILIQTEDDSAVSGVDYELLDNVGNMTNRTRLLAPLTPSDKSRCFNVTIMPRVDSGADNRQFTITMTGEDRNEKDVNFGDAIVNITVRAVEIIVTPGDIIDTVIGDPLYSASIDTSDQDSNLCYEIHGENNTVLNLVSDECFFINVAYDAVNGAPKRNIIDKMMIRVIDSSNNCVDILVKSSDGCDAVHVKNGMEFNKVETFRQNGIQVGIENEIINILLPCSKYPGNGIGINLECPDRYLDTATGLEHVDRRLKIEFNRAKLPESTTVFPHGLVGQFWHLGFEIDKFNGIFTDGTTRNNAFQITHPLQLSPNSFVGLGYDITWDYREDMCVYAGDNQAGSSILVSEPADPIIQGNYHHYKLDDPFGANFAYSVYKDICASKQT